MEDSLELPDDNQCINIQSLLSPEPLIKDSRENTPPHSLAYSNSTCAKDKLVDINMRSPLAFDSQFPKAEYSPNRTGFIKINNQNHQNNEQKVLILSPPRQQIEKSERDNVVSKGQYKKINPKNKVGSKSPPNHTKAQSQSRKQSLTKKQKQIVNQRKTIVKGQSFPLKQRVKQLQQALHIETVISQELRTKLAVTTSLLESKLKEGGLDYFLSLKNTSRDLKNIDIFIEMNSLQKLLTEKSIIIDRQKNQLKQAQIEIQRVKQKKQLQKSPTRQLHLEIERLVEDKESLLTYIDEQKAAMQRKIAYITQLQQEINRIGDKESHYTNNQRPKIIKQMGDLKIENKKLIEELQAVKMELNLVEITYKGQIEGQKERNQQLQKLVMTQERQLQRLRTVSEKYTSKGSKSIQIQKSDEERQILVKELDLLKEQRDHYLNEYRKRTSESAKLYALQLKLLAYQNLRMMS